MNDNDFSGSYFKLDPGKFYFFTKEFLNKDTYPVYDVYIFLKEKSLKVPSLQTNQVFKKTLNYVERFNKFGIFEDQEKAVTKILELRKYILNNKEF